MTQVLENLIGNALKFSAAGQVVRVTVMTDAPDVVLEVLDEGVGIAPEALPHIFEALVQGDANDDRGIGLGMALVQGIVESHGGTVTATSALGEGTCMRVRLRRDALGRGFDAGA